MKSIDLNCDLGESYGAWRMGADEKTIPLISSANVACGWHAGDPLVMEKTIRLVMKAGVAIGAHPGFPDRMGFGRRQMECSLQEIRSYIVYQVGALKAFCLVAGGRLRHVKPHGALYNMAVQRDGVTGVIAEAMAGLDPSLSLVLLAGQHLKKKRAEAAEHGIRIVAEAFPDRAYMPDGKLVPRREAGAVITDTRQVTERAVRLAIEGTLAATDGSPLELIPQTLCIHGDSPLAFSQAAEIRNFLREANVAVRPFGDGSSKEKA